MSVQLQLRHDTAANWATVTPAQAEIVVDTTNLRPLLGDGSTAGGWPVGLETRTAVSDAAYTVKATDRLIAYTALTAARTVTLSAASAYPQGAKLIILDESGSCSASLTITIARAGSDTIDGQTSYLIFNPYDRVEIESNGSNAWTVVFPGQSAVMGVGVMQSSLAQRQAITTFPVPTLRPTTINTGIALDIMPNGASAMSPYSGEIAWIDICDNDCFNNVSNPTNTLTLMAHSASLEIGAKQLFGATGKPLTFTWNGTEIFRINSTGMGIGDTSPDAPLSVSANVTSPLLTYGSGTPIIHTGSKDGVKTAVVVDGYGNTPFFNLRYIGGTCASPSAPTNGTVISQMQFGAYSGGAYGLGEYAADIAVFATQNWSPTALGCSMSFYVTPNSTTAPLQALSINNDGSLWVASDAKKIVDQSGTFFLGTFTVSGLPAAGTAGRMAFATNLRVFNGAGAQQGSGAGTGGLVIDNGTHWVNADAQSVVAVA